MPIESDAAVSAEGDGARLNGRASSSRHNPGRQNDDPANLFAPSESARNDLEVRSFARTLIRTEITRRVCRGRFFEPHLTRGSAWEIITDVYLSQINGEKLSLSAIAVESLTPRSTIMRQVSALVDRGDLKKSADGQDRRRYWISLNDRLLRDMEAYIAHVYNLDRSTL